MYEPLFVTVEVQKRAFIFKFLKVSLVILYWRYGSAAMKIPT